ncbi:MAG: biopolymer transporter ExbD [bacterium]
MGISGKKQRQIFSDINITPLTDIFLVLLIIMMVIAPLLDQQGLNLTVPGNSYVEKKQESKIITIDVLENDKYILDQREVSPESLVSVILEASKIKKEGLLIKAADNATHGAVVKVMDAARNVGISNISIIEK